ncbi:aldo/keto reductase [Phycomyces nitens]|nr:aldo/keto reductase [Phycomyces nitens]
MTQPRELGKTGVKVPPLGFGCMSLSGAYGEANDEESIKTLERAIELGCTFWDTANVYGINSHNERLISRVLKTQRDKIFLATKFGFSRDESGAISGFSGAPESVRKAFDESQKNLGVDVVDLYYMHRVDPNVPVEDSVRAMAELVKEGRVRFLGLSECSAESLRRAHKVHPITAVQMEYSPWTLDIETNGVLATARELGISIVTYSPLGRGLMTGGIKSLDDMDQDDFRRGLPRFSPENFHKNLKLVDDITALAKKKGVTPGQYVLAWILAQGPEFIVIPGTRRVKNLEENVKARDVVLTSEEVAEMRKVVDEANVVGDRYAPAQMAIVGR